MLGKVAIETYLRFKRARMRYSALPRDITLFVTSRCNSTCKHCFYWKGANDQAELADEDLISLIETFPALNSLCLTGGEPTLRNNILALIDASLAKARSITICTNGRLEKKIEKICDTFAGEKDKLSFQVSIDGTEKTHDLIRGSGAYRSSIKTMRMLGIRGFHIIAVLTLSRLNCTEIEEVFEDIHGIASEIRINTVRSAHDSVWGLPRKKTNTDHTPRGKGLALSKEDLRSARLRLATVNRRYSLWSRHNQRLLDETISMYRGKQKLFECFAGRSEAVIYQNGDLSFCEFYKPFLNIGDYGMDFKKAWRSSVRKEELPFIKNCCCVHSCNLSSGISMSGNFVLESVEYHGLHNLLKKQFRRLMP